MTAAFAHLSVGAWIQYLGILGIIVGFGILVGRADRARRRRWPHVVRPLRDCPEGRSLTPIRGGARDRWGSAPAHRRPSR